MDKKGGKEEECSKSAEIINAFLEENEWIDAWWHRNPGVFNITWKGRKPIVVTRFDYFLVPLYTYLIMDDIKILPAIVSDHCPVVMQLRTEFVLKDPGYWKWNVNHLHDKELTQQINDLLDNVMMQYGALNPTNKWERVKNDIHAICIEYSKNKARVKKAKKVQLNRKLVSLQKRLAMINLKSDRAVHHIQEINTKLDKVTSQLKKEGRL